MPILDKNLLKTKFETGDKPDQQDFTDLIDSSYNEEGISSLPSQSVSGSSNGVLTSNGTSATWTNGASGTITTNTQVITVINGIITDISNI